MPPQLSPREMKAVQAMQPLGLNTRTVVRQFRKLCKLYGKAHQMIELENYRALADYCFEQMEKPGGLDEEDEGDDNEEVPQRQLRRRSESGLSRNSQESYHQSKITAQEQAQADAQARKAKAKLQAQAEQAQKTQAQDEARARAQAQAEVQAQDRAKAEARARARAQAQAEVQAQDKAKAEARARAQVQVPAQAQAQHRTESRCAQTQTHSESHVSQPLVQQPRSTVSRAAQTQDHFEAGPSSGRISQLEQLPQVRVKLEVRGTKSAGSTEEKGQPRTASSTRTTDIGVDQAMQYNGVVEKRKGLAVQPQAPLKKPKLEPGTAECQTDRAVQSCDSPRTSAATIHHNGFHAEGRRPLPLTGRPPLSPVQPSRSPDRHSRVSPNSCQPLVMRLQDTMTAKVKQEAPGSPAIRSNRIVIRSAAPDAEEAIQISPPAADAAVQCVETEIDSAFCGNRPIGATDAAPEAMDFPLEPSDAVADTVTAAEPVAAFARDAPLVTVKVEHDIVVIQDSAMETGGVEPDVPCINSNGNSHEVHPRDDAATENGVAVEKDNMGKLMVVEYCHTDALGKMSRKNHDTNSVNGDFQLEREKKGKGPLVEQHYHPDASENIYRKNHDTETVNGDFLLETEKKGKSLLVDNYHPDTREKVSRENHDRNSVNGDSQPERKKEGKGPLAENWHSNASERISRKNYDVNSVNGDFQLEREKKGKGLLVCNTLPESMESISVENHEGSTEDGGFQHDMEDISCGYERVPIPCVNESTSESLPTSFQYIATNIVHQLAYVMFNLERIEDDNHCGCMGDCLKNPIPCHCSARTGGVYAYTEDGCLKDHFIDQHLKKVRGEEVEKPLVNCVGKLCPLEKDGNYPEKCRGHPVRPFIKECWVKCRCNKELCGNRVVQRGVTRRLQVFWTHEGKGWGIRTLEDLPKGAFVFEYVGEVLTNTELHKRNNKTTNDSHHYPITLDSDWVTEEFLTDNEALCLDGTYFGNVARFLNHRCFDSNVMDMAVEIETPDHNYYHVAFFTTTVVKAYEELTWDYGIDFDDVEHPVKAFVCKCGSRYCRDKLSPDYLESGLQLCKEGKGVERHRSP